MVKNTQKLQGVSKNRTPTTAGGVPYSKRPQEQKKKKKYTM
jgi:hypothetical protein